jgi:putative cofactor-binding repeat protein
LRALHQRRILQHAAILKSPGVTTSTGSGIIQFTTTTGATGNDNNLIDHNDLFDGATTPTNIIYSSGTSGKGNSGNTISNNNIYNFYTAASDHSGVLLVSYNSAWTITGNSFYETASRNLTSTTAGWNAISCTSGTSNGLIITNNYIGGTAPNAGGTPLTLTGAGIFRGMRLTVGATPVTSVQGNTIRNVAVTSSSGSTVQSALSVVTGSFNVGDLTPNTIGSQSSTGSITFSGSGAGAIFSGIVAGTARPAQS